ncbi:predicted protein [Naegleria gruberi]|uniref:Predicted protein n=1 Tax=Naegleria gruberi TaxID=5762 RepID=D2V899_NAEGR|nr:uncharacterized protein NAEGRDRAFT_65079 [Naegleria gruberi]EFC47008.1 predicted protein [Naegleria gruberi]|eukprot:XP_002679752.1 predicted protein [Naegleria gruberi strain NEG-M]
MRHLTEDLFVGGDGNESVIFRLDIDGLIDKEKSLGYCDNVVEVVSELKGSFYSLISDYYLVTSRANKDGKREDHYVYDWRSGRMVFNLIGFPAGRILSFVAIYKNGYCVAMSSDQTDGGNCKIHLINMMEKKKERIYIQYSIKHSAREGFMCLTTFEATGNRIVMILSEKPHVFKWDLKAGKLREEYVIEDLPFCFTGCMIDKDIAVFQGSNTLVYNLETKQLLKNIPNVVRTDIQHVGLDSLWLVRSNFLNYKSGEIVEMPYKSADYSSLFQYKDKLLVLGHKKFGVVTEVTKVLKEVHSIQEFNKKALAIFSDIRVINQN